MNNKQKESFDRLEFEVDLQVKYIIKTICKGLEIDEIDLQNIINSQFFKDCKNGLIATSKKYEENMNNDVNKKIAIWLCSDDTGLSSQAMALEYLLDNGECDYIRQINRPYDPADIGRCFRLVNKIPEVKEALSTLAEKSKGWKIIKDNWDLIYNTMDQEVGINWEKGQRATKTYNLMKELGL